MTRFDYRIVGQTEATEALVSLLEKFLGGMNDAGRPLGSALFLGPTGVGKTSAVEAFCEGLFGRPDAMVKIDCGEFIHDHEIAKLLGSPPGYLGHKSTPARLTNEALKTWMSDDAPFSVVLFDEIEKANGDLWATLLGILDKGKLTLGDYTVTDFTSTFIIMTSNVGARQLSEI